MQNQEDLRVQVTRNQEKCRNQESHLDSDTEARSGQERVRSMGSYAATDTLLEKSRN